MLTGRFDTGSSSKSSSGFYLKINSTQSKFDISVQSVKKISMKSIDLNKLQ